MFIHFKTVLFIILILHFISFSSQTPVFTFQLDNRIASDLPASSKYPRHVLFDEEGKVRGYLNKSESVIETYFKRKIPTYLMIVVTEDKVDRETKIPTLEPPHVHMILYNIKSSDIHSGINLEDQRTMAELKVLRFEACYQLKKKMKEESINKKVQEEIQQEFIPKKCMYLKDKNDHVFTYSDDVLTGEGLKTLGGKVQFRFIFYNQPFPSPGFKRKIVERKMISGQEIGIEHYLYFGRLTGIDIAYEVNNVFKDLNKWTKHGSEVPESEIILDVFEPVILI